MPSNYVIGCDLGSQSVKTAIFDLQGRLIAEAGHPISATYPHPGWVEQDPLAFYRATLQTIKQALLNANITSAQIACLALDSQLGSPVRIDDDWNAIGPVECEIDIRCQPQREWMMRDFGDLILEKNGIFPYVAPKLLWWKQEYPAEYQRTSKAIPLASYVAGKLAGLCADQAFTDHTFLGIYGISNVREYAWSAELIALSGIDANKLPRIVMPWDIIGKVTAEVASDTSLLAGTPIAAGLGDAIAGWLGVAAVEPGILVDTSGTSNHLAACVDTYRPDLRERVLMHYPSAILGQWYALGYTAGTGRTHNWFVDEFCLSEDERASADKAAIYDRLEAQAAEVAAGSEGMMFIPHLAGRVCPPLPNVRGTWIGFTWKHKRGNFYRAVLEGIAYEFNSYLNAARRLYPESTFGQVLCIGGGAKSKLWTRIKADVLGLPHAIPRERQDFAPLGSAIVAGHAAGLFPNLAATAKQFTQVDSLVQPDAENHAIYQRYSRFYDDFFERTEDLYADLVNLLETPRVTAQEEGGCESAGGGDRK